MIVPFKALYVASLRRPTVALLLKPLCGVAQTPDCGISFEALSVVSLRRPTVAFLLKSPLCGVAKMPDCGIIFLIFICSPFEASLQTPDRSLFMFCGISGGLPPFSLFTYPLCQFCLLCIKELILLHPCMHLLYLTSELSCEYFQSTHWLVDLARC